MTTHAQVIKDAAYARVSTLTGFFKTFRKTPLLVAQTDLLPCLSVYNLREQRTADGDSVAGEPRFIHKLHLGFSGLIERTDDNEAELMLDYAMDSIDEMLLTDPKFIALFEGVDGMDRRTAYQQKSEGMIAEAQIEMVLSFRSQWPPQIPDLLKTIHVDSSFPPGSDPKVVPQMHREWDIDQEK